MQRSLAFLVILVLAAPAAGALLAPPPVQTSILPGPRDGDVLVMLGREMGLDPTRLPTPEVPAGLDVPTIVTRLAERHGTPLSPEEAAIYRELHPSIAAPVLTLLVTMEAAWDMRDAALGHITREDWEAHLEAERLGLAPTLVITPDQQEAMLNAAIMLSDTLDTLVLPQLDLLANTPVWPPIPLADPVGILYIGTTGNDITGPTDRFLQIDPRGNDQYENNAGGAAAFRNIAGGVQGHDVGYVIAISIDLHGDDTYDHISHHDSDAQGAGSIAIGFLIDLRGSDYYRGYSGAQGAGSTGGVGVFRDASGDDNYRAGTMSIGGGSLGIGYFRDDTGNDHYLVASSAGGYGSAYGLGLMWERGGDDEYAAITYLGADDKSYGGARTDGRGWFVDESGDDVWLPDWNKRYHPLAGNDRTWGTNGARGNDNMGGLAYVIAKQQP